MRIVCDNEKCTGCLACVVTCLDHHYPAEAHGAVPPRRYEKAVLDYTIPQLHRNSGPCDSCSDSCRERNRQQSHPQSP